MEWTFSHTKIIILTFTAAGITPLFILFKAILTRQSAHESRTVTWQALCFTVLFTVQSGICKMTVFIIKIVHCCRPIDLCGLQNDVRNITKHIFYTIQIRNIIITRINNFHPHTIKLYIHTIVDIYFKHMCCLKRSRHVQLHWKEMGRL